MTYLEHVRALASRREALPEGQVLQDLVSALEAGEAFHLDRLYALPYAEFELAMGALREWWACRRLGGGLRMVS